MKSCAYVIYQFEIQCCLIISTLLFSSYYFHVTSLEALFDSSNLMTGEMSVHLSLEFVSQLFYLDSQVRTFKALESLFKLAEQTLKLDFILILHTEALLASQQQFCSSQLPLMIKY